MPRYEDKVSMNTKVIAILRKAPKAGEHPLSCQVVEERDFGPNLVTKVGRHLMAAWCSNTADVQPSGWTTKGPLLGTSNRYSKANNWFVGAMSVGTNDSGSNTRAGTSVVAGDLELNNEYANTFIELQSAVHKDQSGGLFTGLSDLADAAYTQIAWRGLYSATQANTTINEVGLWIPAGTTNPEGNSIHNADPSNLGHISKDTTQVMAERGPLVARKVLTSGIAKTSDFTLEFRWVWIF